MNRNFNYESLYVHVPFCADKCDYCAFYSEPISTAAERQAYLRQLRRELADSANRLKNLHTIFIGGGTPALLSGEELKHLLKSLEMYVIWRPEAELTLESNPENLTSDKLKILADFGINRISIGIQSFDSRLRATLGRRGTLEDIELTRRILASHGFINIGLDLIYNIPHQSMEQWHHDLGIALALDINHLSVYELTFEEGTRLASRIGMSMDALSEKPLEMWKEAARLGFAAGLRRYEVSNLAQPGYECRHNNGIWHGASYLGCGPAAWSFDGRTRRRNPNDLGQWLKGREGEVDELRPKARAAEILAFGLRTAAGWSFSEFRQRTGFEILPLLEPKVKLWLKEGLLEVGDDNVRPTEKGLLFADYIAEELLEHDY